MRYGYQLVAIASSLLLVSACGSDSDSDSARGGEAPQPVASSDDTMTPTPPADDGSGLPADPEGSESSPGDNDATAGQSGEPAGTGAGSDELTNPREQIITADCGIAVVAETRSSDDESAPATLVLGEAVRGRIDPESLTNTRHFWNVEVQPGFYHVIIETQPVDGEITNIGVEVTDLDREERVLRGNTVDNRSRYYDFLEIASARTLRLSVDPVFDNEDYLLAIYPNGASVPTPFLEDCPTITPIVLGETRSVELGQARNPGADAWYMIDLEEGDYQFSTLARRLDGDSSNLIYEILATDQFGQAEREERALFVNEVESSFTAIGPFSRSDPGAVWLRLVNRNDPLNVDFTLQPAQ